MESHIGNITGHAKHAEYGLSPVLRGVSRGPWAMEWGRIFPGLIPSPAISSWASSNAAPLLLERCLPIRICPTRSARGLDRSNMPPWNIFTEQQKADLVAWVKHFSPRFADEKPGTPIQIPSEPEVTADRIKAGREVFARVQCWKCHGVTGEANGPSASTLAR